MEKHWNEGVLPLLPRVSIAARDRTKNFSYTSQALFCFSFNSFSSVMCPWLNCKASSSLRPYNDKKVDIKQMLFQHLENLINKNDWAELFKGDKEDLDFKLDGFIQEINIVLHMLARYILHFLKMLSTAFLRHFLLGLRAEEHSEPTTLVLLPRHYLVNPTRQTRSSITCTQVL